MNILHVISSRGWGGAENSAAYLAKTQIEHGNNAYFFIHSLNRKLIKVLSSVNAPYFSTLDPERKNVFAVKKIINVCRRHKIDIIHTHLATGCYLGVIAGNRLGIPALAGKKLQNSVKFWGYQSDVRPFINMFDIAVSYTTKEIFGLNNVEYMLIKKPCVSANSGGMPELYGDTGILVEPDNPYALKEALKKYANDPELMKQEAGKGYERAICLFNAEKIYNDTIKEYESVKKYNDFKK